MTAKSALLIRSSVAEVFEAFINPEITTKFWFTKSSGRLEEGAQVTWEWEMFGVSDKVHVKKIEENKRILIEWGSEGDPLTTVEWTFTARPDNTTFVSITNYGFAGDQDKVIEQVINATEGFTLVLCNLKALLEHNIDLRLIRDRFPDGPGK